MGIRCGLRGERGRERERGTGNGPCLVPKNFAKQVL